VENIFREERPAPLFIHFGKKIYIILSNKYKPSPSQTNFNHQYSFHFPLNMHFKSHLPSLPSKPLFTNLNPFAKRDTTTDPLQTAPNDLPSSVSTNEFPHYSFDDWARGLSITPDLSFDLSENEREASLEFTELWYDTNWGYERVEREVDLGGENVRSPRRRAGLFRFPSFGTRQQRNDEDKPSQFASSPSKEREAGNKPSRFPSFSLRSRAREKHDGDSERSTARRNSIWSIASGRSGRSSASSISKWSFWTRKSSTPTIMPTDMGVVREESIKERLEERPTHGPTSDLEQSPDLLCEDTLAPPPSLVCSEEDLVPPRSLFHLEGVFQDERWVFPADRERKQQSPLKQHVDDMVGGRDSEHTREKDGVEQKQIKDLSTTNDIKDLVLIS